MPGFACLSCLCNPPAAIAHAAALVLCHYAPVLLWALLYIQLSQCAPSMLHTQRLSLCVRTMQLLHMGILYLLHAPGSKP